MLVRQIQRAAGRGAERQEQSDPTLADGRHRIETSSM
jgi:hypothetical protein